MKTISTFIIIVLAFTAISCNTDMIPQDTQAPIANIYSRGENNTPTLQSGSLALFNAQGQLEIDNEIFTFDGNSWKSNMNFEWKDSEETTYITAIHPVHESKIYTAENLYSNNVLEDILIAQDTLPKKADINLLFKHLFSSLEIIIENSLLEKIKRIEVTTPYQVSSISPTTGEILLKEENHTTTIETDGSHAYSIVVPPAENCILTLSITMSNDTKIVQNLASHTFESGISYECNLRGIGIYNANDLIDFCQLINGTYQGSKTLNDFGKEIDGKMVYSLLKDITLTEEDCAKLSPIANDENEPFNDIFDGRGFTINNLILADLERTGLFGYIGEFGIVKNLHMNNASMKGITLSLNVGVIASHNDGLIDGCSVSNSTIKSKEKGYIGVICSKCSGYIINSYTQNNIIHTKKESQSGSIVSSINGRVVNCYTYNNTFTTSGSKYYIGSIAGTSFGSTFINNCFIYHEETTSNWGAAVGNLQKCTIKNFYYNKEGLYNYKNGTLTKENTPIYDTSFQVDGNHISTLLDNWVTDPNRTVYKDYTFKRWKIADDGSACFQ